MVVLLGPSLVIAGFGLYMLTNTWLGRFRRMPWEFLAVSAAGVALSLLLVLRSGSFGAMVAAGVSITLFAFLIWFFFVFSMYGPREDRPRVGDPFPSFRLPTSDGSVVDLAAERGKPQLLIFYRGSW